MQPQTVDATLSLKVVGESAQYGRRRTRVSGAREPAGDQPPDSSVAQFVEQTGLESPDADPSGNRTLINRSAMEAAFGRPISER